LVEATRALGYLSPAEYERVYHQQANRTIKSSTALRTAWPPQTAGAVQCAAVSIEESITLSGPLSNQGEERAEKLQLQSR